MVLEEEYITLLINMQKLITNITFANDSSVNIKLSKAQLPKIGQSIELVGRVLGPLLRTRLPLIGNAFKLSAKSISVPLGLTEAASGTDAVVHMKMFGCGTTLIICNEEMNDIM